jgi:hypothetical protein
VVEVHHLFRGICCLALIMEAENTSEMPVSFYQITWCYNPEDSHLHTMNSLVGFEVFALVTMKMAVFWVIEP